VVFHAASGPFVRAYRHTLRAENRALHDHLTETILQPLGTELAECTTFGEVRAGRTGEVSLPCLWEAEKA